MILKEKIEEVIQRLQWHYDPDADENDTSPEDMTAHVNGICIRILESVLEELDK